MTLKKMILFLLLITSSVVSSHDKVGKFIYSLSDFVKDLDFSRVNLGNSKSLYYRSDNSDCGNCNIIDIVMRMRLIDGLSPVSGSEQTLDPILKYPLIAMSLIIVSTMIIFAILDISRARRIRGRRLCNIFIIGVFGIFAYAGLYFTCNIIKLLVISRRLYNSFIVGVCGIFGYTGLDFACHIIKLLVIAITSFLPHFYSYFPVTVVFRFISFLIDFYPYLLGTIGFLFLSFIIGVSYNYIRYRNKRSVFVDNKVEK